jgi:hypothetical protein
MRNVLLAGAALAGGALLLMGTKRFLQRKARTEAAMRRHVDAPDPGILRGLRSRAGYPSRDGLEQQAEARGDWVKSQIHALRREDLQRERHERDGG